MNFTKILRKKTFFPEHLWTTASVYGSNFILGQVILTASVSIDVHSYERGPDEVKIV